ncbi:MAG: hypothetical protein LW878_11795 [Proteobacteria bacterium]|jgi:hypothetical protein|nr:hypothetical protein [Pseudomonadota bacterium]
MKFLLIVMALFFGSALADTSIRCSQLPGAIYPNSAKNIQSLSLVSYVNHFSLANMMAMQIETDSGEIAFGRQTIEVTNTTNVKLIQKTTNTKFKIAWLLIDRTPRIALNTRYFRGVLFISGPLTQNVNKPSELSQGSVETFNFECAI